MKVRTRLISVAAASALIAAIGTYAVTASSQEGPPFMHAMGGHMMPVGGMMDIAQRGGMMGEMRVIHAMITSHDSIRRSVTNLPDGIRTVTESDDPAMAELVKQHVARMGERVAIGDDPGLPIESAALHAIFRDKDKIRTTVETTEKGIIVVQTSTDPATVTSLQEHAGEVDDLVKGGMPALHAAMMKNGGMRHGPFQ